MNTVQIIANVIESRIEEQSRYAAGFTGKGWGKAKKNAANLELWVGAAAGLRVADHADAEWVERVVVLLISTRGYEETQKIAREGRDEDRLVELEAEKEADIDRVFIKA